MPEYQAYEAMIHKLAYSYSRVSPYSVENLISEGNLVFVLCLQDYNPNLSSFSNYLYKKIRWHFADIIRYQNPVEKTKVMSVATCCESDWDNDYICIDDRKCAEDDLVKRESYYSLSSEAKEFINTIFNGPKEIIDQLVTPVQRKFNKRKIWKYLSKNFGIIKARRIKSELEEFVEVL